MKTIRPIRLIPIILLSLMTFDPNSTQASPARQLTSGPKNHDLDNNQNYTRDGKWLVYDTRDPGIGESRSVEKVNIDTGEVVVLYAPEYVEGQGPGSGATSVSPADDRIVFIHGPWARTGLPYDFTYRRGGLISAQDGSGMTFADARDITPPFTPGALRGGTHRHEWDGTGKWIGYTYNDDIMKKQQGIDLRTIGVTHLGIPVTVEDKKDELYEGDGEGWSVLVVHVVPDPKPGTEDISRAASDSWVGLEGYLKEDGTRQRARAFIGNGKDWNGKETADVFIVDIPDDLTQPGPLGPLQGTETTYPAPPQGASQRRLTWTADWDHPGASGTCWSSPEGDWITFLAHDKEGVAQIFAIHPTGGDPVQISNLSEGVASSPRWSPNGKGLVAVSREGRLFAISAPGKDAVPKTHAPVYLTEASTGPRPEKPVWSTTGDTLAFNAPVADGEGSHLQIFVVDVPKSFR